MHYEAWSDNHALEGEDEMFVDTTCIEIDSKVGGDALAAALRELTADGPFIVSAVEDAGPGRHRCRFGPKRSGLVVGYRSVIELQYRIDRHFNIVSVEHQPSRTAHKEPILS